MPLRLALAHVGRRATSADRRVDLHRHPVDGIGERNRLRTASRMRGRRDAVAERAEKRLHDRLLLALRGVVRGPVLRVRLARDLHRLGHDALSVDGTRQLDGDLVLALRSAKLVIRARAGRGKDVDEVSARVLRLRRDEPHRTFDVLDPLVFRERLRLCRACIHATKFT